jgi:hypothetical protein
VPGVSGAVELSSGDDVDCIRDGDGAMCWSAGSNGPGADALPPTRLPVSSVVRVVAGAQVACTLDANGQVTCFGIDGGHLLPGEPVNVEP